MKYVVAATYVEFSRWLQAGIEEGKFHVSEPVKYVRDYSTLLGARLEDDDDDVIFLPGWEELPEARAIMEQVQQMRAAGRVQKHWEPERQQRYFEKLRNKMIETGDPFVEID